MSRNRHLSNMKKSFENNNKALDVDVKLENVEIIDSSTVKFSERPLPSPPMQSSRPESPENIYNELDNYSNVVKPGENPYQGLRHSNTFGQHVNQTYEVLRNNIARRNARKYLPTP